MPQHARGSCVSFRRNRLGYLAQLAKGTCRHCVKPAECGVASSLGSSRSNKIWCSSGPIDIVPWPPDRQCNGSGRTTLHGFPHQWKRQVRSWICTSFSPWMKVRRKEAASERLKTSTCFKCGDLWRNVLKATEPSGAMSRWLTRREHL